MALPRHIGDLLDAQLITLVTADAFSLLNALERRENVLSVGIKAYSTNAGTIYVGTATSQPWPLAAGEAVSINVSKMSKIYVKGTVADKIAILVVRTTGELSRAPGA